MFTLSNWSKLFKASRDYYFEMKEEIHLIIMKKKLFLHGDVLYILVASSPCHMTIFSQTDRGNRLISIMPRSVSQYEGHVT